MSARLATARMLAVLGLFTSLACGTATPAAPSAAQATPSQAMSPPAATSPAALAGSVEDLTGRWYLERYRLTLELRADRTYEVRRGGATAAVDAGAFSFEGGRLTYRTSTGMCGSDAAATYEVRVRKQDGRAIELDMTLVGDDACADRRAATGPWKRVQQ